MGRRNNDASNGGGGSLELLLDTICNIFGGIVFIALLLTVMSDASGRARNKGELPRDRAVEARLTAEWERLQQQQSQLEQTLQWSRKMAGPEKDAPPADLEINSKVLEKNVKQREGQVAEKMKSADELGKKAVAALQKLDELAREKEELERKLKQSDSQLTEAQKPEIRKMRLPKLHEVKGKKTVFIAVCDKKFYAVTDLSRLSSGSRTHEDAYDREDTIAEEGPGGLAYITLKGGQIVSEGAEKQGKLNRFMAQLISDKMRISIFVKTNSFPEFLYIKNLIVEKKTDYVWWVLDNEGIVIGTVEKVFAQ